MKLELKKSYAGFQLIHERKLKELDSIGRIFHHVKSGARLVSLENKDDNKVFSVSFRTPPEDSTGVAHILEHSVLCGSRKFPTKEPFVELVKGSLNTFLNALTFPDKTMYPVASRNEKDFRNLMDVYMDAVFYPNIYKVPEIFMQEGWHYELENQHDEINYKGVVYSEMKGVFSSPESILFRKVPESLFPDTCYGVESGGDPDFIPDLTYTKFIAFHEHYYHPSNSYFFLYGDGDILAILEFMNSEYLRHFDKMEVSSSIKQQEPFTKPTEVVTYYPIAPPESDKEKSYLSLNFVASTSLDRELYLALNILEYLLLETPAAPLKKALIDVQLGKDIFGQFERSILQPIFSIVVKDSEEKKKEEFKETVYSTLRKMIEDGIDKKLIEAAININEFKLREADYRGFPKGLVYCIQCMDSWLYDADPFIHLEYEPSLSKVRKALTGDYFESLIDRCILNNPHSSLVIVNPRTGLSENKSEEVRKKLKDYKATLSADEIKRIGRQTKELKARQVTPDSPEALEAIPILSLSDIDPKAEKLPIVVHEERGSTVLFHPVFTSKIAYLNLYFDTSAVSQEELPYLTVLAQVMGRMSTAHYHYSDLSNEINIHTGGVNFSTENFIENEDDGSYYPKIVVRSKALINKLPKLGELLDELMGHFRFDDKKRLKEIIQEVRSRTEMSIYQNGHLIAIGRLLSYFSPAARYNELMAGLSFYRFITDIEKNFEQRAEEVIGLLQRVAETVFKKNSLIVSITTAEEDYGKLRDIFPMILGSLSSKAPGARKAYQLDITQKNEGLLTPGKVLYVAKGYNFKRLGYSYSGKLQVLRTIASMDFLWNRIRVQGGAYGSFARFARNGNMYFCSYRDPNLKETLSVYDEAADYLSSFDGNRREMTKYILGTISKMDAPLTPSMKGEAASDHFIRHITQEDIQQTRNEVLSTTQHDIRGFSEMVSEVMKQNHYCVIGDGEIIKNNSDMFDELVSVF